MKINKDFIIRVAELQPELLKKPRKKTPIIFVELPVFDWVVIE